MPLPLSLDCIFLAQNDRARPGSRKRNSLREKAEKKVVSCFVYIVRSEMMYC